MVDPVKSPTVMQINDTLDLVRQLTGKDIHAMLRDATVVAQCTNLCDCHGRHCACHGSVAAVADRYRQVSLPELYQLREQRLADLRAELATIEKLEP